MIGADDSWNAEPRRAEESTGIIDSIALEAIGSVAAFVTGVEASLGSRPNDFSQRASESVILDDKQIDEYCVSQRLELTARLRLFIKICEAVHSAHQHAAIHGNLKPGNILVTPAGVPKLINFGCAKPVHVGSDDNVEKEGMVSLRRAGEPVLPIEYASPEQVTGEAISTASDIYTLGVILYELTTGRRPYFLKTGSISEISQAICEQVPARPSTIAPGDSTEQLKRTLGDDLDAIILMAMRKEPESRYSSADQFADDLKFYLKRLPVRAHPDSAAYRTIKFMHRHPAVTIASSILTLALSVGLIGTTAGLFAAWRERNRVQESFRQANTAVNQFVDRLSKERLLSQPGLQPIRKKLLENARQFYASFLKHNNDDRSLQVELARAQTHLGEISGMTGATADALEQLENAVGRWENLVATQPANSVYREALAHALAEQGSLMMLFDGRREEALRNFQRARDLIEPLAFSPVSVTAAHELAAILHNIAELERGRGQAKEAIEHIQKSLVIEAKLADKDSDAVEPIIAMAKGHAILGQILFSQPEGAEPAQAEYQQAVELLEKVNHNHPELSDQTFELAFLLGDLSGVQQTAGKLDSALASLTRAVEILEHLERRCPGVLNYEQGLANTYNLVGDLHRHRREPAEGIAFAQKAQTLLNGLIAQHPGDASLRIELAKSQNSLGRLLEQTGEPVAALRSFQRAVDFYESITELSPRDCYNLACNVALSIPLIGVTNGSTPMVETSKLSKSDQLRRKRYGDRAVDLLRTSVEGGFLGLDILRSDTDLDPIRDRADFQSLMNELEEKSSGQNVKVP